MDLFCKSKSPPTPNMHIQIFQVKGSWESRNDAVDYIVPVLRCLRQEDPVILRA